MTASLATLPPELVHAVMTHLPVPELFALGQTNQYMHSVASISLTSLQLGVFPTRLDGVFSNLDAFRTHDATRNLQITLPAEAARTKDMVLHAQDTRPAAVLRQHAGTLRDVELALWDLQANTAKALAQMRRLEALSIRLDHPHTRHRGVDKKHWHVSPGSTVWNELYGPPKRSGRKAVLGGLERLTLERAGVTDYQLCKILAENPRIRELRLRKCRTLTAETFEWLARSEVGRRLEVLCFEESDAEDVDEGILDCIAEMPALRTLSLHGCRNIANAEVELRNKAWGIRDLTLPQRCEGKPVGVEVDPAYK